jgi:hypothetical protein
VVKVGPAGSFLVAFRVNTGLVKYAETLRERHRRANVYSHGVTNVAIFTRALTAAEVGVLNRWQSGHS